MSFCLYLFFIITQIQFKSHRSEKQRKIATFEVLDIDSCFKSFLISGQVPYDLQQYHHNFSMATNFPVNPNENCFLVSQSASGTASFCLPLNGSDELLK